MWPERGAVALVGVLSICSSREGKIPPGWLQPGRHKAVEGGQKEWKGVGKESSVISVHTVTIRHAVLKPDSTQHLLQIDSQGFGRCRGVCARVRKSQATP